MPYITQKRRAELANPFAPVPQTPGELNYLLTKLVCSFADAKRGGYQTINDIVGALEGAKLEFYRRVAAPYEDGKIQTNGDVYERPTK